MLSLSNLRKCYGYTTGSHRIPPFNSSIIYGLDVSVRIIALSMSITSMSFSDIDGITATTTDKNSRWRNRGIRLSPTSKKLVVMPGSTN